MAGRVAAALVLGFGGARAMADSVSLLPVADATLFEVKPTNSLGGATWFSSGTTQNFTKNRGLVRFDVAGSIPRGSRILGATITVKVMQVPRDGYASAFF